jgi:NAD(P)-dependent dehydrogenase (short-subunit alcohol dehydrogenase family)
MQALSQLSYTPTANPRLYIGAKASPRQRSAIIRRARIIPLAAMPLPPTALAAPGELNDRVVLITGATGGLGRALALECGKAGATVVIHGRVVRKLESLYDDLLAAGAPEPVILPLDLAKAEAADFANIASALEAQLGRLDAIVHTAVQLGSLGPIEHQSFDQWLTVLRVDLAAPMGLTRALVRLLMQSPDGSVTFTLDTRGESPHAYWGSYAAAKAGLSALATILADEWEKRENLRVNAVIPGPMRSPLRNQTHPAEDTSALPEPGTLAPLYLYLIAGQPKAESGARIDAQAWLAGAPAVTSLLP